MRGALIGAERPPETNNENGVKNNESEYDRLLHDIYETIDNPCAWKDFCAHLRESIGAVSVHLFGFDRQRDLFSWSDGFGLANAEPLERIRPLYRDDARLSWLRAFPAGKWLHCGVELDGAEDGAHANGESGFALYPVADGHRCVALCKLVDHQRLTVILACSAGSDDAPLSAAARTLLERLAPHLLRAVRLYARRFALNADALAARKRAPAMLVSAQGEVLHSNEPAQELLRATSLVRVRNRRLALAAPHHTKLLEDIAVSEARLRSRASGARAAAARFRALRIIDDGNETTRAANAANGSQDVLYAFYNVVVTPDDASVAELRAYAALTFYHPRSAPPVDEKVLAAAFDLSPAECRIALLLAEGLALKEIAAQVGVQHDTVRKQLQSVFQKTATRRQPDLLRLLLNLPGHGAAAAPDAG